MDKPKLQIWPYHLLILLAPLGVLIGLESLLHAFGDATLEPFALDAGQNARVAELVARYRYMAAFAFLAAMALAVVGIVLIDIGANHSCESRLYVPIAFVTLVLAFLGFDWIESWLNLWDADSDDLLGDGLLERALKIGQVNVCQTDSCSSGALIVREALNKPINYLNPLAATASLLGLVLSLARPPEGASLEVRAASLRDGVQMAHWYLFCMAALLTAGMAFQLSWMHWPAGLIANETERTAYRDLVGALSLYVGVGYSVLIMSGYLPVMLVHVMHIERFKRDLVGSRSERETDPALAVPELHYVGALSRLLAILAPILTSAVGSLWQDALLP